MRNRHSNGRQIAEYSTGATPPANPTTNYTATDMLGSPRVLTDSQGNVVSRRDFLPFGEELYADGTHRSVAGKYSQTGQDGVRQRFTGYEKDTETGLDFAEARMYENRYGRFTAIDPLLASGKSANPQTFNRYTYVLNNPLLLTDPDGLQVAFPGKWYMPVTADGESDQSRKYKYILNGESTDGYNEVTMRNRNGDLIGYFPGSTLIEGIGGKVWADFVARFNPMGPQKPMPTVDMNTGRPGVEVLTEYDRKGWEIIVGDDYSKVWPSTGAVADVSVETFTAAIPVAQSLGAIIKGVGSAALARATQSGIRNTSSSTVTVGRWMGQAEFDAMKETRMVQESFSGATHVAYPASPNTYIGPARPGSLYVEFGVPRTSVVPTGGGYARIITSNSIDARLAARAGRAVPETPRALNPFCYMCRTNVP